MNKTEKAGLVLKEFFDHKRYREGIGWDATAIKAQNFYFGNQYDNEIRTLLRNANRADSVFNHVLPAVELISGHHIQMQTDMVAKPVDRVADPYIAKFVSAGMKQIEQSNDVPFEDTAQFLDGLITGVGVKDMFYDTDESVDGKVMVQQDTSFDYYLDMNFRRYDYSDATRLFRCRWLTKEQIEELYGKKVAKNLRDWGDNAEQWYTDNYISHGYNEYTDYGNRGGHSEPATGDSIPNSGYDKKNKLYRVVERFKRVSEKYELYWDEETNDWGDAEMLNPLEYEMLKDTIITRRRSKIVQDTLVVNELVVDGEDTGCRKFTQRFNLFFPYFHNGRYMGAVESLFSPQEEINKRHSSMIHILSTIGANKLLYTDEFLPADSETDLATEWPRTGTAVRVNALQDESGNNTYQIVPQPQISPVFQQDMAHQEEVIKDISGATYQMRGQSQRRESGSAKRTEIEQGAVRLEPMIKNFRKTRKLAGQAYIYYMQKYYGEDRYIRIYGEHIGDSDQEIVLNKQAIGFVANDISVGEYDIVIEFEGKTPSERTSTYWRLVELANTVPNYADIIGEVILGLVDMPEKDTILAKYKERQEMMQQQQMMPDAPQGGARRQPQRIQ